MRNNMIINESKWFADFKKKQKLWTMNICIVNTQLFCFHCFPFIFLMCEWLRYSAEYIWGSVCMRFRSFSSILLYIVHSFERIPPIAWQSRDNYYYFQNAFANTKFTFIDLTSSFYLWIECKPTHRHHSRERKKQQTNKRHIISKQMNNWKMNDSMSTP